MGSARARVCARLCRLIRQNKAASENTSGQGPAAGPSRSASGRPEAEDAPKKPGWVARVLGLRAGTGRRAQTCTGHNAQPHGAVVTAGSNARSAARRVHRPARLNPRQVRTRILPCTCARTQGTEPATALTVLTPAGANCAAGSVQQAADASEYEVSDARQGQSYSAEGEPEGPIDDTGDSDGAAQGAEEDTDSEGVPIEDALDNCESNCFICALPSQRPCGFAHTR